FEARSSVHTIHGSGRGIEGVVEAGLADGRLDPASAVRARVEVPVDRLTSGNPLSDTEMRRRIDARRFPTIVGEVLEMTPAPGAGRFAVRGDLTFHGVTRAVEGEVTVTVADDRTITVEGERVFDVREFGITPPRILMLRVEPEVTVRLRLVARRR